VQLATAPPEQTSARHDFRQDVPEPLRELVRRCVLRGHAQRIVDAESLALELERLADELASRRPAVTQHTPPALRVARQAVAREAAWSVDETVSSSHPWAAPEDAERYQPPAAQPEESRQPVWSAGAARIVQAQSLRRPSRPFNAAPTIGDR